MVGVQYWHSSSSLKRFMLSWLDLFDNPMFADALYAYHDKKTVTSRDLRCRQ